MKLFDTRLLFLRLNTVQLKYVLYNLLTDKILPQSPSAFLEALVRDDWSRLMSALVRDLRDIELAEDALAEAVESALTHWSNNGVPHSAHGWLLRTARRKANDRLRRATNFASKNTDYLHLLQLDQDQVAELDQPIPDESLALMFTCAHPSLSESAQIGLTLQVVGGLKVEEIARSFLLDEKAMAQRLVRAKRKIRHAGIPFQVPTREHWNDRLNTVLGVLYLIFSAGHATSSGSERVNVDLCEEAIRLAGLLALMLLHHARTPARTGQLERNSGEDRSKWDQQKIKQGLKLIEQALHRSLPGFYQLQAAISAIHARARNFGEIDWQEIVLIYERLLQITHSPVVRLNQAVAMSYAASAEIALPVVERLQGELHRYQPYYAALADLLRRCHRGDEAEVAYLRAIELSSNGSDLAFLAAHLRQ